MRDIKFRGISLDTGKMIYGYGVVVFDNDAVIVHKQGINLMQHTQVDPQTVGQYTGRKDRTGVGIFEGDIINGCSFNGSYRYGIVAYEKDQFIVKPMGRFAEGVAYITNPFVEVIGNVYENPDLLETKIR